MVLSRLESLKVRAKLLQKRKKQQGQKVALKEMLLLVAQSLGFSSWRDLKKQIELSDILVSPHASAFWHVWYRNYEQAEEHLEKTGGFLLPYQKDFFICDKFYIESIGISAEDEDLLRVGNNWAKPNDHASWEKLVKKIIAHKKRAR